MGAARSLRGAGGALARACAALRSKAQVRAPRGRKCLVDPTSYEFSPSFVYHDGLVASVVRLYARRASNRRMSYQDAIDLIPTDAREGVSMYLVETDGVIRDDAKKTLIRQNARGGREAIAAEDEEGGSAMGRRKDALEREMDEADWEDYGDYELALDSPEPIVYFAVQLVVVGPSREAVDDQIADLNVLLDQRHPGFRWDSVAGEQHDRLAGLYRRLEVTASGETDSSLANQYCGINFAATPGLCDERGVVIGEDVLSLVHSSAVFDFDGSTKAMACVAIPRSEPMALYHVDGVADPPAASVVAQAAANDIVMCGHRAAHMVLNDFDYGDRSARAHRFFRPDEPGALAAYDVASMTINPLQGFGSIDDVQGVYARTTRKVLDLFDLMCDLGLGLGTEATQNERAVVTKAISDFYVRHGLWSANAAVARKRTRLVEIARPELFPTMADLISEFTSSEDAARTKGSSSRADAAERMHDVLAAHLNTYRQILGRTTSIEPSDALQCYYSFAKVPDAKTRQIQFLNILDYVLHTLCAGDALVVHGAQGLWREVLNSMAAPALQAAMDRGVRVVLAFDVVQAHDGGSDRPGMGASDLFSIQGPYYRDLSRDLSWSMVGPMLAEQIERYAEAMNHARLSDTIRVQAAQTGTCQVLLHRDAGHVNNFVCLSTVI